MDIYSFLKRRGAAVLLLGVIGFCVVYALAFVRLYSLEHPYRVASHWIFANVPAGSRIASPHWDDKVPVGIPGKDPGIYQMNGRDFELPIYERDTPQMIETIVRRVASADYLAFATPRAADSIPRIADEYPNTTALLRLLWAEKIGFRLVYTTKNRPSFLGFTFNDDLADESFSVYDHPKVVVFKNEERLSPEQILGRIRDVDPNGPLPSMDEMLLMDRGGWMPSKEFWRPEWGDALTSLGLSLIIGVSFFVLAGGIFRFLPDGGLGIGALLGVVGATGTAWGLSALGIVPLTRAGGVLVVFVVVVLALVTILLRSATRSRSFAVLKTHGVCVALAIAIGAVVVSIMRGADSALLGLGEHIDAAYLSYLIRSEDATPWDLFHPGLKLPWAFVDRFILAWVLKTSGTPPEGALNVSFVVLGGLVAGSLYSIFVTLIGRARPALVGVLITIIPLAYLMHVARDVTNKPIAALWDKSQMVSGDQLARLIRKYVTGTPLIVEACDQASAPSALPAIGLPKYEEVIDPEVTNQLEDKLCLSDDPEQVYHRMMGLKLEFFLTPSAGATSNSAARSRYERFLGRPDLFARVFEDQERALFVTSFSRYYPRNVPS
jgi:hypothetical protein